LFCLLIGVGLGQAGVESVRLLPFFGSVGAKYLLPFTTGRKIFLPYRKKELPLPPFF
jgi:hypothetical protein